MSFVQSRKLTNHKQPKLAGAGAGAGAGAAGAAAGAAGAASAADAAAGGRTDPCEEPAVLKVLVVGYW